MKRWKKWLAVWLTAVLLTGAAPFATAVEENLALGCAVTASSYDEDHIPEHAVDGDTATRWASKSVDDSWIAIDLGESCRVSSVTLVWEAAYAEGYKLQVSSDGAQWTDAYETDQGHGGTETVPLTAMTRYLRMKGIARTEVGGVKYGYSLYEIRVAGVRPKADKSDLTAALDEEVREELYTPDSLAVYHAAAQAARAVEENIDATPEEVAAALGELLDARAGLTYRELGELIGRFGGKTVTASHSALDIGSLRADAPIDLYGRDLTQVYLLFTVSLTNPSGRPDKEIFNTGMIRLQDGHGGEFVFNVYSMAFGFHAGDNVLYFPLVDVAKGYGRPEKDAFDWRDWQTFRMYLDSMGGEEGPFTMTISDIAVWDVSASSVLPGDVDESGEVTAADALMALQAATGKIALADARTAAADVDGVPGVSAADALMILQAATGKIVLE
ncbi:MAG: discoidin domain-containing protein [Acutalibacteraceae bacterium]|jgi:hypothetical protein